MAYDSPLDELASIPGAAGDAERYRIANAPLPFETPDQTDQRIADAATVQQRVQTGYNRIKAGDLARRSIPAYADASGNVQPVTDPAGAPVTQYNKAANVGYDGSGNPVQLNYGEDGAPKVESAFAGLNPETDPKTGDQYLKRQGLPWQWVGQDDATKNAALQRDQDKAVSQASDALGRKLTLDERQLHLDTVEHAHREKAFTSQFGPIDYADLPGTRAALEKSFDPEYATPEANDTGWFGSQLKPDAAALRASIDQKKAKAIAELDAITGAKAKIDARQQQMTAATQQQSGLLQRRADSALGRVKSLIPGLDDSQASTAQTQPEPGPQTSPTTQSGAPAPSQSQPQASDQLPPQVQQSSAQPTPAGQSPASLIPGLDDSQKKSGEPVAPGPKPYLDDKGNFAISETAPVASLTAAVQDGALPNPPPEVWKAAQDKQALIDAAGSNPKIKAALAGAGRGAAFLATAPIGAGAGAAALSETGPGAAVGGLVGGLITGSLGAYGYGKLVEELAKHNDTINSFVASQKLHPGYSAAGELATFGAGLPRAGMKAIGALAGRGADALADASGVAGGTADAVRATQAAQQAASAAGQTVAGTTGDTYSLASNLLSGIGKAYDGAGGITQTVEGLSDLAKGAAKQAVKAGENPAIAATQKVAARVALAAGGMAAIDTVIKEGGRAIGLSDEHQTLGGLGFAALLGAFTAGHGIDKVGYSDDELADIMARGWAHDLKIDPNAAGKMGLLQNAGDLLKSAASKDPLTPEEQEIYSTVNQEAMRGVQEGRLSADPRTWQMKAEQILAAGRKTGVSSADVEPRDSGLKTAKGGEATPPEPPGPPKPVIPGLDGPVAPAEKPVKGRVVEPTQTPPTEPAPPAAESTTGEPATSGQPPVPPESQTPEASSPQAATPPTGKQSLQVPDLAQQRSDAAALLDQAKREGNSMAVAMHRAELAKLDQQISQSAGTKAVPTGGEQGSGGLTAPPLPTLSEPAAETQPAAPSKTELPSPVEEPAVSPPSTETQPRQDQPPAETSGLAPQEESSSPVDTAAHESATSPKNDLTATPAQVEAGNAKFGHVNVGGLRVTIEHPAGTSRKPGWQPLAGHYGYIKGTVSGDGENIDTFVKPGTPTDYQGPVYVINRHPAGKGVDHKAVIGADSAAGALAIHNGSYPPGLAAQPSDVATFRNTKSFKDWATGASRRTAPAKGDTPTQVAEKPSAIPGLEPSAKPAVIAKPAFEDQTSLNPDSHENRPARSEPETQPAEAVHAAGNGPDASQGSSSPQARDSSPAGQSGGQAGAAVRGSAHGGSEQPADTTALESRLRAAHAESGVEWGLAKPGDLVQGDLAAGMDAATGKVWYDAARLSEWQQAVTAAGLDGDALIGSITFEEDSHGRGRAVAMEAGDMAGETQWKIAEDAPQRISDLMLEAYGPVKGEVHLGTEIEARLRMVQSNVPLPESFALDPQRRQAAAELEKALRDWDLPQWLSRHMAAMSRVSGGKVQAEAKPGVIPGLEATQNTDRSRLRDEVARRGAKGEMAIFIDDQLITPKGKYSIGDNGKLRLDQELSVAGFERNLMSIEGAKEGDEWFGMNTQARARQREIITERERKNDEETARRLKKADEEIALIRRSSEYRAKVEAAPLPAAKKTTIKIATSDGKKRDQDASIYGDFAIHKSQPIGREKPSYVVTHVPSGLSVIGPRQIWTLNEAKKIIQAVIHSGADMSSAKPDRAELDKALAAVKFMRDGGEPPVPQGIGASDPMKPRHFLNGSIVGPGPVVIGASNPLIAHHGTPHKVDKFSLDKVGTGEGAAAYGWGLYFAENPEVAKEYRERLTRGNLALDGEAAQNLKEKSGNLIYGHAAQYFADGATSRDALLKKLRDARSYEKSRGNKYHPDAHYEEVAKAVQNAKQIGAASAGNTYAVHLDVEPDQLLDWDKPLSEQGEKVKSVFGKASSVRWPEGHDPSGEELYSWAKGESNRDKDIIGAQAMKDAAAGKTASDWLAERGIPGIRYLDAGSRGPVETYDVGSPAKDFGPYSHFRDKAEAENHLAMLKQHFPDAELKTRKESQTSNYVLFDDSKIRITHENGQPVSGPERAQLIGASSPLKLTPKQKEAARIEALRAKREAWRGEVDNGSAAGKPAVMPQDDAAAHDRADASTSSSQGALRDLVRRLDEDDLTPQDVADELDGIVKDGDLPDRVASELDDELQRYRRDFREDREIYGERAGLEAEAGDRLVETVRRIAGVTPEEASVPVEKSTGAVDVSSISSAKTQEEMQRTGGSLMMQAKTSAELGAIQRAMKEWKSPESRAPSSGALTPEQSQAIQSSYRAIAARTQYPAVSIGRLAADSGVPLDTLKSQIVADWKAGKVVLSKGDWSLANEMTRNGAVEAGGERYLQVRYLKPEKPSAASPLHLASKENSATNNPNDHRPTSSRPASSNVSGGNRENGKGGVRQRGPEPRVRSLPPARDDSQPVSPAARSAARAAIEQFHSTPRGPWRFRRPDEAPGTAWLDLPSGAVVYDLPSLSKVRDAFGESGDDWLRRIIREENIHRRDFVAGGNQGLAASGELQTRAWNEAPASVRDAFEPVYGDAGGVMPSGAEIIRMLAQLAEDGSITESGVPLLEDQASAMEDALQKWEMPQWLADHVRKIQSLGEGQRIGASNPLRAAADAIAEEVLAAKDDIKARPTKDLIKAGYDAVGNMANSEGVQERNNIRLDFDAPKKPGESRRERLTREKRNEMDKRAARLVVEAGGDADKLVKKRAELLAATPADKAHDSLIKRWLPRYDHAIANFDDLTAKADGHRILAEGIYNQLIASGEDFGERKDYVRRVVQAPPDQSDFRKLFQMGDGRGNNPKSMEKARRFETIGDAILHRHDPGDYGIHEADQNMAENAYRIIGQKAFIQKFESMPAPVDGKPIIGKLETVNLPNGTTETRVPKGYTVVQVNGAPKVIHNQVADLFKDLYGTSALRQHALGRAALKFAAFAKTYSLVGDTFHGGRVLLKMAVNATEGGNALAKGRAVNDYADADLGRAVAAGEISQQAADWARKERPLIKEGMRLGLNIGKVADNLIEQARAHVPGFGKLNDWIFNKLARNAMTTAFASMAKRNIAAIGKGRFKTREEAIRQAAKEANEQFGNLQNQGLFTNKTLQDLARLLLLAPQWTEAMARSEGRAYAQFGKTAYRYASTKGKDAYIGNSARALAIGFVALLAVNQVINYLTRGHSTFQNPEEHHSLDAWLPGGRRGFWFSPFEIIAEYMHAAEKYAAQHEHPVDIASHIARNKLSPLARGTLEAATGRDGMGRHYLSNTDRFRAAASDALPSPLPLGAALEKDPRQPLGYRVTRAPGAVEKQLLQSVGAKVTPAQSPRTQMFALAQPFRADAGKSDSAGEYTELRRALDNNQDDEARSEIQWLLKRGKDMQSIGHAVGVKKDGSIQPERFTGGDDREKAMLASLTPEQRAIYRSAQEDHVANAKRFQRIAKSLPKQAAPLHRLPAFTGFN